MELVFLAMVMESSSTGSIASAMQATYSQKMVIAFDAKEKEAS